MKKIITIVLVCMVMLMGVMPYAMADASDVVFDIVPDKTDVNPGDTVTYTISVTASKSVCCWQFYLDIPEGMNYVAGSGAVDSSLKNTLNDADNNIGDVSYTESLKMFFANTGALEGFNPTNFIGKKITIGTFQCTVNSDAVGAQSVGLEFEVLDDADLVSYLDESNYTVNKGSVSVICEHATTEIQGAKDATCSEEGYTGDKVCTVCSETVEAGSTIPTTDHNYVAGTVVTPDCDDAGYTVYTCSGCGATENRDPVAALGHDEGAVVVENNVAATCTEAGSYENVVYCTVCEKELSRETVTVEALGHDEGDVVVENDKKPTCTEEGSYDNVVYCTVCTKEISREKVTVEALGHDEKIDEAVAETCTDTGLTEGKHCDRCKEVLVAQEVVDALGHDEKIDAAVAPTCTADGKTEGKHCDRCGEVLVAQEVDPKLGHTGGEATCVKLAECARCGEEYGELNKDNHKGTSDLIGAKEPTCTEDGATGTGTCSDCGAELDASEVIPALGHAWDEGVVTTPATCEADGVKTFTCGRCGDTYTEAVAKLGHAYDSGVVTTPATCEADGVKTFTCANDASHTYTEVISAIGHDYDDGTVTTEPTCEAEGVKTFVCQNDPTHTYPEAIPALGHEFDLEDGAEMKSAEGQHWIVCAREGCGVTTDKEACSVGEDGEEATCVAAAVCGTCGESFGEADPDAHDLGMGAHEGKHWNICGREGCGYESDPVDCTFDQNKYKSDDDQHWIVCDVCGMTEKGEHEDHVWGEWVTEQAPTATQDGYALRQCETCGFWAEKTLPAVGGGSGSGSDKDNSNIPDTGDDSPIALLAIVTILCASSVVVLTTKKRKN